MSGVLASLIRVFKLLFSWGLSLLGIAVFINPTPIPGTDKSTSNMIAFVMIVIGGVMARWFTTENEERRRARIWKKEWER